LRGSIEQIRNSVDVVIAVTQMESNFGEVDLAGYSHCRELHSIGLIDSVSLLEPMRGKGGAENEKRKRNYGLNIARSMGCTHFISMDCDEYYLPDQFRKAVDRGYEFAGSVCEIQTYYKRPDWHFGIDSYYVPFLHQIGQKTQCGSLNYPYYVDPTRGVVMGPGERVHKFSPDDLIMHHFSYIRTDLEKKLRNSSARRNLNIPQILQQYEEAGPGKLVPHYGKVLIQGQNLFEI